MTIGTCRNTLLEEWSVYKEISTKELRNVTFKERAFGRGLMHKEYEQRTHDSNS